MSEASDAPMTCGAGCGGWYPHPLFDELLRPVLRDTRHVSNSWWKRAAAQPPASCPVCARELDRVGIGESAWIHRCTQHGTWLDGGVREALEAEFGGSLARYRQALALAAGIARGDHAALRDFAIRFVELEYRVAELAKPD
jgi:hypothetical protein